MKRGAINPISIIVIEEYLCHNVSQLHDHEIYYIDKRMRQEHPLENKQNLSPESKNENEMDSNY